MVELAAERTSSAGAGSTAGVGSTAADLLGYNTLASFGSRRPAEGKDSPVVVG